jgi:hypothetical protein
VRLYAHRALERLATRKRIMLLLLVMIVCGGAMA